MTRGCFINHTGSSLKRSSVLNCLRTWTLWLLYPMTTPGSMTKETAGQSLASFVVVWKLLEIYSSLGTNMLKLCTVRTLAEVRSLQMFLCMYGESAASSTSSRLIQPNLWAPIFNISVSVGYLATAVELQRGIILNCNIIGLILSKLLSNHSS
jgi:hypothetical protein